MPDYDRLRATADRLVRNFGSGRVARLSRTVPGVYDPVTDTETGAVIETYDTPCVRVKRGDDEVGTPQGDLTEHDKAKILIPSAGLPITPAHGDRLRLPGEATDYVITDVATIQPDGDAVLHSVLCQRASA